MRTFSEVLERAEVGCPDQALADIEVPSLPGLPQRQGDVGMFPRATAGAAELAEMTEIPQAGLVVVRGEETGNTHILMPEQGHRIFWKAHEARTASDVGLGVLHVPESAVAWLIHTDEHGVNRFDAGTFIVNGKREQAEVERRVQD
jgi:hypothetical protein